MCLWRKAWIRYVADVLFLVSAVHGIRLTRELLRTLPDLPHVETHLVVSAGARLVVREKHEEGCGCTEENGDMSAWGMACLPA